MKLLFLLLGYVIIITLLLLLLLQACGLHNQVVNDLGILTERQISLLHQFCVY